MGQFIGEETTLEVKWIAVSEEGGVLDVVMNVGGFGQTEEQLVVQSETRVYAGLAFMLLGTITQVALYV